MSRKNGTHFNYEEIQEILIEEGFVCNEAEELAKLFETYSFKMFDALCEAIKKIKKGA